MKIKLGIIGEEHSINILQEVIEEYDDYELSIFIDTDETRTLNIIADHQQDVDAWLVFDQINYLHIENWGQAQKTVYYIPYRGASFYKTLCTAIYQGFKIDELSIDTMTVKVRYERATPSLISFTYGAEVEYYKDDKLYARYYLKDVERNSKYEYTFSLQSAIGLLDDTNHYGGIYSGQSASDIIKDIIGGKITYTEHNIFSKIKVYGWLPVATRRDNLKQLLFAVGGCVKKKDGIINFSTLTVDTPTNIPANRVYDSGKITYNAPASRIEVIEHQFSKVDNA